MTLAAGKGPEEGKHRKKSLWVQIYLEPLVILLSQHGSLFNWTGTNGSVLRWFCHANVLRQLNFTRFRGGFCEFVCTESSFLRKLSSIRTQLNRRGAWEPPDPRQRQRCRLGGVQVGCKERHLSGASHCASFPTKVISCPHRSKVLSPQCR